MVFYAVVAYGRAAGFAPKFAEIGRYLHLALALLLPAVAVAADAVVRRWHFLLVPVAALFLIAVPANLAQVDTLEKPMFEGTKRDVLLVARPEAIEGLPPDFHPFPRNSISVGWLREQRAAGRIPDPAGPVTAVDDANTFHVIALSGPGRPGRLDACPCAGPKSECSAMGRPSTSGACSSSRRAVPGRWPLSRSSRARRAGKRSSTPGSIEVEVTIRPGPRAQTVRSWAVGRDRLTRHGGSGQWPTRVRPSLKVSCMSSSRLDVPRRFQRSVRKDEEFAVMSARVMIPELARLCGHEDLGELSVLDVGCGVKFSQVLMNEGLPVGRYVGVDVYRPMIDFLRDNVSDERFEFHHVDFRNERYNPEGTAITAESRLPVPESAFDVICLCLCIHPTSTRPTTSPCSTCCGGM